MEEHQVYVYPTLDFLSHPEIEKAARDSLFGPRMQVFSGGWSYHDPKQLLKLPISPVVVANANNAEEIGLQFFQDAQSRWAAAKQESKLLPIDSDSFRLKLVETKQLWNKRRPLAWTITWAVLANLGSVAKLPNHQSDRFVPVDFAEINLTISLTGRVVEGSATWRPTSRPLRVTQHALPDQILAALMAAKQASPVGHHDDNHVGYTGEAVQQQSTPSAYLEMRFAAGVRHDATQFIDPRLHYVESNHSHGAQLVIPATDYGLAVQILTVAEYHTDRQSAAITVTPWVTSCHGAVTLSPMPVGHQGRWEAVDMMVDAEEEEPVVYTGGEPLTLDGLWHVSFTISNELGCVAHADAEVCGAVDLGDIWPNQDGAYSSLVPIS